VKRRRSSVKRIALSSARGPALSGPCSGRSEAISTSGVSVPEITRPHDEIASESSVAAPATLTHAAPAPAAMACGAPTEVLAVTLLMRGSMRDTTPSA
jgi:hypothetical protein